MSNSIITDELLEKASGMPEAERRAFLNTLPKEISDQVNKLLAADEAIQQKELLKPVVGKPTDLDDYEIIREIGRGGMGIVYEAQQLSLARTVALKVLPFGLFHNPNALQRFQLEAKSAARLHHSNIVPIYDVGCDREQCYYAMQYIEGQTLDSVLAGLKAVNDGMPHDSDLSDTMKMGLSSTTSGRKPFYCNVAAIFQCVADALHYAHENGMVHRDVKPANLMLDLNGTVWVTDFGLVKTEESDLTETGDVVGTLRYMSPERFSGQCDRRSDVYSLGMTLYEMFSQRPAFGNTERLSLIEAIRSDTPESLRKIDKQIPRDLETIVAKAIEKDPRRRYATAGEMADDLGRFIGGQPIQARRVGNTEKLCLWAKKRKALAASLAALASVLVLTTVGAIAAAVYFSDLADKNLSLANSNEKKTAEADEARTEAVREANTKGELLDIMVRGFQSANYLNDASGKMGAVDVLKKICKELGEANLDAKSRYRILWSLVGSFSQTGDNDLEVATLEECLELSRQVNGDEHEDTLGIATDLQAAYLSAGRKDLDIESAIENFEKTKRILGPNHKYTSVAMSVVVRVYRELGRHQDAIAVAEEMVRSKRELVGEVDRETIGSMLALAKAYLEGRRYEDAIEIAQECLGVSEKILSGGHINRIMAHFFVSEAHYGKALHWASSDDLSKKDEFDKAIAAMQKVVDINLEYNGPKDLSTLRAIGSQGIMLLSAGHDEAAFKMLERNTKQISETFGPQHRDTILAMGRLSHAYVTHRRFDDAVPIHEKTLVASEQLFGPDSHRLISPLWELGGGYMQVGRNTEGLELFERSLKIAQATIGLDHPDASSTIRDLAAQLANRGMQLDRAVELFNRDLKNGTARLGKDHPRNKGSFQNLTIALGKALRKSQRLIAEGDFEKAECLLNAVQNFHGPHKELAADVQPLRIVSSIKQEQWAKALDKIKLYFDKTAQNDTGEDERPDAATVASVEAARAESHLALKQFEEAEAAANRVLDNENVTPLALARAKSVIATCQAQRNEFERACELAVEAADSLDSQFDDIPKHKLFLVARACGRCVEVYTLANNDNEASDWQKKLTALETRISQKVLELTLETAERVNKAYRRRVVLTPAIGAPAPMFEHELPLMRRICEQHPTAGFLNTLCIAEYRMGNFEEAIAAAKRCSKLLANTQDHSLRIYTFAVLAMSHWQLDDEKTASDIRGQLDDLMNQDGADVDVETHEFTSEAIALLDNVESTGN